MSATGWMTDAPSSVWKSAAPTSTVPYAPGYTSSSARIRPEAFVGVIFLALALSIITATARIALRLHRLRQFAVDDGLLVFSVLCLSAASALLYQVHSKLYYQVDVSLGKFIPGSDFEAIGLSIQKMLDISSVLIWTAIFTIKVSFLCFFHKLVDRIRNLTIWWRIVFALVIVCGCICIPFTFSICPDFSQNFFERCGGLSGGFDHRGLIYLVVTVILDIFTDLLLISLPVALLWNVKIPLQKKLILGGVLGLSIFLIGVAIVRVTVTPIDGYVTDTPWLFFWQFMEGAIAVCLVSVSAFRSTFGQTSHVNVTSSYNKMKDTSTSRDLLMPVSRNLKRVIALAGQPSPDHMVGKRNEWEMHVRSPTKAHFATAAGHGNSKSAESLRITDLESGVVT